MAFAASSHCAQGAGRRQVRTCACEAAAYQDLPSRLPPIGAVLGLHRAGIDILQAQGRLSASIVQVGALHTVTLCSALSALLSPSHLPLPHTLQGTKLPRSGSARSSHSQRTSAALSCGTRL